MIKLARRQQIILIHMLLVDLVAASVWSGVQCSLSNPISFYLLLSLSFIAYLLHSYAAGGLNSCHSGLVHTSQAVGM